MYTLTPSSFVAIRDCWTGHVQQWVASTPSAEFNTVTYDCTSATVEVVVPNLVGCWDLAASFTCTYGAGDAVPGLLAAHDQHARWLSDEVESAHEAWLDRCQGCQAVDWTTCTCSFDCPDCASSEPCPCPF